MAHILDLIDKRVLSRESEWHSDHFHVSSLGGCLRGVILARKNPNFQKFDARTLRVFECGHLFERYVVDSIPKDAIISTQETVEWPEFDLVGRCDLITKDPDGTPHLYELKSQHSASFHWMKKAGGANPMHIQQVSLYFSKLKDKFPGLKQSCVYVSKDDLCVQEYLIEYKEEIVTEALKKAKILKDCWDAGTLPELEKPVVFDPLKKKYVLNWRCTYCPVHTLCTGDPEWEAKAKEEVDMMNGK